MKIVIPESAILPITDVVRLFSLSKASVYRQMQLGRFPRPVRIANRRVGWRWKDLEKWQADLQPTGGQD